MEEDEVDTQKNTVSNQQGQQKRTDKEKKKYEKKILELTKNNSKLNADLEMWRRKCNVIQEKYQSMKSLFNKDKFIGLPNREEENNMNHPNHPKKCPPNTPNTINQKLSNPHSQLIDELNSMAEQLKSARAKKHVSFAEEVDVEDDE